MSATRRPAKAWVCPLCRTSHFAPPAAAEPAPLVREHVGVEQVRFVEQKHRVHLPEACVRSLTSRVSSSSLRRFLAAPFGPPPLSARPAPPVSSVNFFSREVWNL